MRATEGHLLLSLHKMKTSNPTQEKKLKKLSTNSQRTKVYSIGDPTKQSDRTINLLYALIKQSSTINSTNKILKIVHHN